MIDVKDLLTIAGGTDMPAVVRVTRTHCVRFRTHPERYSAAERSVITEAAKWRRDDPRPAVPGALHQALTDALQREVPALETGLAKYFADVAIHHVRPRPLDSEPVQTGAPS